MIICSLLSNDVTKQQSLHILQGRQQSTTKTHNVHPIIFNKMYQNNKREDALNTYSTHSFNHNQCATHSVFLFYHHMQWVWHSFTTTTSLFAMNCTFKHCCMHTHTFAHTQYIEHSCTNTACAHTYSYALCVRYFRISHCNQGINCETSNH